MQFYIDYGQCCDWLTPLEIFACLTHFSDFYIYVMIAVSDMRIILLGKTGSGKSTTGNTIFGEEKFRALASPISVTKHCENQTGRVNDRVISVVDTPGIFYTLLTEEQLKAEKQKCIYLSAPGPHVFLLVMRVDMRFTEEEKRAVKWIQNHFSEDASKYVIILFTHVDQLEDRTIEELLDDSEELNSVLNNCGGRYHCFDNRSADGEKSSQVSELLMKINKMVRRNGGRHYTNEMYQEAQRKAEEEEKRRKAKEHKEWRKKWLNTFL